MPPFRHLIAAAAAALFLSAGAGPAALAAPAGLVAKADANLYDEFMRICVAADGDRGRMAAATTGGRWSEVPLSDLPPEVRSQFSQLKDARIRALDYDTGKDWSVVALDGIFISDGQEVGPMCVVMGPSDPGSLQRLDAWRGDVAALYSAKGLSAYIYFDIDGQKVAMQAPGALERAGERKPRMLIAGGDQDFTALGLVHMDK